MGEKNPQGPPPHLYDMAYRLKLERRLHPRVKFPLTLSPDFSGPKIFVGENQFAICDLSEGSACIDDPKDAFNGLIGKELVVKMDVGTPIEVPARVVGSNIQKRHIQFLVIPENLKLGIRVWVQYGLRGQWFNRLNPDETYQKCPILWSSLYNDSLFLSEDPRWKYTMSLDGEVIHLDQNLWPASDQNFEPISLKSFDRILVCLENLNFKDESSEFLKKYLPIIRRRSFE